MYLEMTNCLGKYEMNKYIRMYELQICFMKDGRKKAIYINDGIKSL